MPPHKVTKNSVIKRKTKKPEKKKSGLAGILTGKNKLPRIITHPGEFSINARALFAAYTKKNTGKTIMIYEIPSELCQKVADKCKKHSEVLKVLMEAPEWVKLIGRRFEAPDLFKEFRNTNRIMLEKMMLAGFLGDAKKVSQMAKRLKFNEISKHPESLVQVMEMIKKNIVVQWYVNKIRLDLYKTPVYSRNSRSKMPVRWKPTPDLQSARRKNILEY